MGTKVLENVVVKLQSDYIDETTEIVKVMDPSAADFEYMDAAFAKLIEERSDIEWHHADLMIGGDIVLHNVVVVTKIH